MLAHIPPPDLPVPLAVQRVAAGDAIRPAWRNEAGGLTFELASSPTRRFVKWAPAGSDITFDAEAARLRWAAAYLRVPRPLEQGADEEGRWLVTAGIPGESAVSPRWLAAPGQAAAAIGAGLRALHDRLPVSTCPFSWSAEQRSERASAPIEAPPPVDRLVVCHGDACAPNTLIGADGQWSGHVDLGALGVADRWADLAVATWSLDWNYGDGWGPTLLDAYGIAPDPGRISYYRRLWDLT